MAIRDVMIDQVEAVIFLCANLGDKHSQLQMLLQVCHKSYHCLVHRVRISHYCRCKKRNSMIPHYQNNEADINVLDCYVAYQHTPLAIRENLMEESHLGSVAKFFSLSDNLQILVIGRIDD